MSNWVDQYIGIPWVFGGRDMEGFDCWGLFRHVQKEHFNVEVADVDLEQYQQKEIIKEFAGNKEASQWKAVKKPKHGCGVMMSLAKWPNHVGIWIEDSEGEAYVLHSVEGMGVICTACNLLGMTGYKVKGYYEHKPSDS